MAQQRQCCSLSKAGDPQLLPNKARHVSQRPSASQRWRERCRVLELSLPVIAPRPAQAGAAHHSPKPNGVVSAKDIEDGSYVGERERGNHC